MGTQGGPHIRNKNLVFGADAASDRNGFMGNIVNPLGFTATNNNSTGTSTEAVKTLYPNGNSEYISYGSSNDVRGLGDITIMGWAKQYSTTSPHQTVFCTSTGYRYGLKLMSRYHGQWSAWVGDGGSDDVLVGSGNNITDDGLFHCICCTRNESTSAISLYQDGALVTTNTNTGITGNLIESGVTAVATDYHSSSYYMNGLIGQVWVWDTILTATEILQVYNATKTRYI